MPKRSGYVRLGGDVVHNVLVQDVWVVAPQPKGTDLSRVRWRKLRAIVDTGCTSTAIRMDIAAELGLPAIGRSHVRTASTGGGYEECSTVMGLFLIYETTMREAIAEHEVIAQDMADDMLFGMDLLDGGILTVDMVKHKWLWRMMRRVAHSPNPFR